MSIADLAQLAEHLSCKQGVGGSNPLVGTFICGSSSVVEHHLAMVGVAGSNPVFRSSIKDSPKRESFLLFGMWLSLVERYVRDVEVAGSNPVIPIEYYFIKKFVLG